MKGRSSHPIITTSICNWKTSLPEHGEATLQFSISNDEFTAAPNQAVALRLDIIKLAETSSTTTPYKSPRNTTTSDNYNAKMMRSKAGGIKANPNLHKSQGMRTKEAIPNIDIASQPLKPPHSTILHSTKNVEIIHVHRTNEEICIHRDPLRKIINFNTLPRAFLRVPQYLYLSE